MVVEFGLSWEAIKRAMMPMRGDIEGSSFRRREQRLMNIQIIDRANNATFSLFQATEEEFAAIFPGEGQDMELIEDFFGRVGDEQASRILLPVWERPILKRDAQGIHGTLYYGYADRKRYLPVSKREVDWDDYCINSAQRQLFASKR
jgi:hypothetical protein